MILLLKKIWPFPLFLLVAVYAVESRQSGGTLLALFVAALLLAALTFWTARPQS